MGLRKLAQDDPKESQRFYLAPMSARQEVLPHHVCPINALTYFPFWP